MIYSKDDVKRILEEIRRIPSFFYKNDNLPPKVIFVNDLEVKLKKIEEKL